MHVLPRILDHLTEANYKELLLQFYIWASFVFQTIKCFCSCCFSIFIVFWGENDFTPSFFIHFFLLPKLGVKDGDGQHTTPALSRKGSIWPLELRLLTLTKRAQLPNVCHTWEDFYGGKAFTPTKNLRQILYLLLTENSFQYCGYVATTYKPMEQPWKQR